LTPDSLSDISVASTGRPLVVTELTVNAYNANQEQYESMLIKFTSLRRLRPTPLWGNNAAIPVYQTVIADSTLLFLDADTPVPGLPEPTYPVTVTGVAGQFTTNAALYNDGYEIIPRMASDFETPPAGLSGNYTVGASGAFPTLDSAFATLQSVGVSGPVTFSLTDSVYRPVNRVLDASPLQAPLSFMTEQSQTTVEWSDNPDVVSIVLTGPIPGASATNRVTVSPAAGTRARIVGTGSATFLFTNVSFVTFNGIGTTGATQMSVENTASGGVAFALLGNSDNNILQNMTIRSPYANGICVYADTASGAATDSNEILNNLMPIGSRGVYLRGGNFVAYGNRIMGNVIGSDSIGATLPASGLRQNNSTCGSITMS
jgi:hypothetical protein